MLFRSRPATAREQAVKWAQRKPAIAGLLAAVVLVTLIGFVGVTWQWQRATSALEQMTDAFQQKNTALNEKDSAYQSMNQALKETKAAVQEKDSALTAKQTALESRIQALADKDAALIEKERQRAEAEANSYSHIIASAHHEWLSSNPKTSAALLQQCSPQYRHWEWRLEAGIVM